MRIIRREESELKRSKNTPIPSEANVTNCKCLPLQKYERAETTMLDRWSITVSDVDPDPIRRAASTDGLEVSVALEEIARPLLLRLKLGC